MKTITTLTEARFNGEDKPKGTVIKMDDSLATEWLKRGLAVEHNEESSLPKEDSIKKQEVVKKANKKKTK